ncbi:hypothetical protein NRIC_37770 [Enterococcus florum]|uniref:Holin n=1 Tax=Enterococcus florum TaxID=2480627 RepID=A0A4P5PD96_9ENTE|nr:phage holin family protein [Enterococcus florum]GCF95886.1 hypothetical protein NRIC_37770 [Enterococcus florum]
MDHMGSVIGLEGRFLNILSLISLAMLLDLSTGLIAAKLTRSISSKKGINGILRKIVSLILLLFFVPVARLIPMNAGEALLYAFYLCFLVMEIHSILENCEKMGIKTDLFKSFLDHFNDK